MSREFIFPDLGEGITDGELVRWLVKEGDQVKEDQDVAEVETDKALVTIPSPIGGVVERLGFKEGERVPVGAVLMRFGGEPDAAKKSPTSSSPAPVSNPIPMPAKPGLPPLATPHTRKIAREMGVDLNRVTGSGPAGRITEADLRDFAESTTKGGPPAYLPASATPTPGPSVLPQGKDFEKYGVVERVPLKGVRRKISENMLTAQQQTVMVTHMDEADVGVLQKIHREKAEFAKQKGVKLTLLPFLMKASAIALRDHPSLNASLSGEEIIFKKYYHFGFAVDTEVGLLVPVIRNVDKKSILHLASELAELSRRARERKIQVEEFQGHSFSLTNIGSIGGKAFTPIINYPDSAILGVGRSYEKPVVVAGKIVAASILPLCLSFDHRVTDGATAARFVNQVIGYLQDPDLLLLEDGED
jgi:pyruvate dehydrogenase E2 component (dihydrolipoamide acetyltransferase)